VANRERPVYLGKHAPATIPTLGTLMSSKALVIYDGECAFCVSSVEQVRRLDVFRRLSYADARDASLLADHPEVDPARALARLQLVPPGRGALEGFYALRWLAGRLPLLWILWPVLWIPGIAPIGVRAYDFVARNRFVLGSCDQGACELDRSTGSEP
jgi:predicted DCC family thiol-disulfide oxidoreductase YuxK